MSKPWLMLLILTSALVAWLFAPALSGAWCFGFRDAAHFYYPLFEYIREEWAAGRVPLWNPYENCGGPLLAENTSSVFYPGKLLFALPLDYAWLYNVYIVSHVVLAAATSYCLARHLRARPLGAVLGAISYAFCGNVLFQYCNVIFLVGAAWLPLALLYADRMLRLGERRAAVRFGVVVALIVLGGDPHLAYNVGLASAGYALLLWRDERRVRKASPPGESHDSRRRIPWRLVSLSLGTLVAAALSAIQVLPSLESSPYGERAQYDVPRNIYEYASARLGATSDEEVSYAGLLGGQASGHHDHIYAFSLQPSRAIEFVWPNVTGRSFPTNRRWLNVLNAEFTVWSPSLYMGLLPLVLAILSFSLRRRAPVEIRGLSWLALLAALASLGWFGPGWLVQSALGTGGNLDIGGELGGVYWLLATFLPGYVQFRYPQKLFVLASLALSMLAARGWRSAWRGAAPVRTALVIVAGASIAAAALALVGERFLQHLLGENLANTFQGPFDWSGAWTDLADGLLHGFALSLVLAAVFTVARRQARHLRLLQWATLAIVAVDLGVAQRALIEYAPARLWKFRPAVLDELAGDPEGRVYRQDGLLPPSFEQTWSPRRCDEAVVFERQTLRPKYPLADRVPVMQVSQSVAGSDFEMLLDASRLYHGRVRGWREPDPSILKLLGVRSAIVGRSFRSGLRDVREIAEGAYLGRYAGALPRAWIVHQVQVYEEFHSRSPRAVRGFSLKLMFPDQKPRDWRREAVIETGEPIKLPALSAAEIPSGERCTVEYADPLRVEIAATLKSDGLVVLADQYFPGWELSVETAGETRSVPILRTNRVLRGAVLPPGAHRLVYRYRPKSFLYGAIISGAATAALALAGCVWLWRHRRRYTLCGR